MKGKIVHQICYSLEILAFILMMFTTDCTSSNIVHSDHSYDIHLCALNNKLNRIQEELQLSTLYKCDISLHSKGYDDPSWSGISGSMVGYIYINDYNFTVQYGEFCGSDLSKWCRGMFLAELDTSSAYSCSLKETVHHWDTYGRRGAEALTETASYIESKPDGAVILGIVVDTVDGDPRVNENFLTPQVSMTFAKIGIQDPGFRKALAFVAIKNRRPNYGKIIMTPQYHGPAQFSTKLIPGYSHIYIQHSVGKHPKHDLAIDSALVSGPKFCAMRCEQNPNCQSFSLGQRKCHLYDKLMQDFREEDLVTDSGTEVYQ